MQPTGEPDATEPVALGPAEYFGPEGYRGQGAYVGPDPATETEPPRRRRGRVIAGTAVALLVLAGGAGVLLHLRSTPQWQVLNAAQATIGSAGTARITMADDGADDLAYEVGWSQDPGALAGAVVRTGAGGDQSWLRVVYAGDRMFARTDLWAKGMLPKKASESSVLALPDLPAGSFGDALESGRWIEISSLSELSRLSGLSLGIAGDAAARAQLERLREIVERGVRGHTAVTADGSDERGDRYRVVVDLKQAALDNADDLQAVLADLAGRYVDTVTAPGRPEMDAPKIDVRKAAADLKDLPLTVWVRDGRLSALRVAARDATGNPTDLGAVDIAFGVPDGPLAPTDAVKVTTAQLDELQDSFASSTPGMSAGSAEPDLQADLARFRDTDGRAWIRLDKDFVVRADSSGTAARVAGTWRTDDGEVIVLTRVR